MARFEKGNPGRPKGSKNKKTEFLKKLESGLDRYWDIVMSMDDEDFAKEYNKLLNYVIPTLKSQELKADVKTEINKVTIEVKKPE